ncbi:DUF1479-domain-containing protein [Pleurostoma richardsiae]|uniref:DUF1479-domain-containing protein n=1 Tax=Pleurostoma richardsiae TaxID=41990 RepID=A0AA38RAD9_9PEZI|nr:DUF1479-domain-containing protein [Pleurostoma richardsiae]
MLVGAGEEWPDWPEHTPETAELQEENIKIKKEIAAEYGEASLRKSWLAVCEKLKALTDELAEKQSSIIREIPYDDFFRLDEEEKQQLRDVGCFVVRGTISKEMADGWFNDLNSYVEANRDKINGWPEETPYILRLYWSKTQMEARTHPRVMALHRALNSLWHDVEDPEKTFAEPLAYADSVRIRPPGKPFKGLGPHIDAGSLSRWGEPAYRKVFDAVWTGKPDEYDPFDLTARKKANPAYYPGSAHSHVLRLFQGWTALTPAGPHEGSLLLYPNLKTVVAYMLLRPFFQPPKNKDDVMDASKWTFDTSDPWFPGTWRAKSQELSPDAFPHLRIKDCLVHIPKMAPGDTIWWHCDMCHAVEVEHRGDGISSVAYVAATPTTKINEEYIQRQLQDFLAGTAPEDFRGGCNESAFKGYPGSDIVLNGDAGRRAVGYTA